MHYNGITNHFIVYIVHDFLGNHRSIASFTAWKCNQSKLILAGELRWWKMYKMNTLLLEVLLAIVIWYFARYFSWTLKNNKNDHNVIKTTIMMKDYTMKYEQAMRYMYRMTIKKWYVEIAVWLKLVEIRYSIGVEWRGEEIDRDPRRCMASAISCCN